MMSFAAFVMTIGSGSESMMLVRRSRSLVARSAAAYGRRHPHAREDRPREHRHAGQCLHGFVARVALEHDDAGRCVPEPLALPNGSLSDADARRRQEVYRARENGIVGGPARSSPRGSGRATHFPERTRGSPCAPASHCTGWSDSAARTTGYERSLIDSPFGTSSLSKPHHGNDAKDLERGIEEANKPAARAGQLAKPR
jgi:hypothetical protein